MLYPPLHEDVAHDDSATASESAAYTRVLAAFRSYKSRTMDRLKKKRSDFNKLPERHRALVPEFLARLDAVEAAVAANQVVLDAVAASGDEEDALTATTTTTSKKEDLEEVTESDIDKIRSTLRQFVRDWGAEGQRERDATYLPVLDAIERNFASLPIEDRGKVKILVPGAGLGRLAFEIVRQGYSTQGNEYSFFMLVPSNYILNKLRRKNAVTLQPWLHTFSNLPSAESQLRKVTIPDVPPADHIPPTADFSMVAGDFLEVYNHPSERAAWDVVATCYFIDTGRNILAYIETIATALRSGGLWVNIGPLLYHFEGMMNESSIELNLDEVLDVVKRCGFVIEESGWRASTYTGNNEGMLKCLCS